MLAALILVASLHATVAKAGTTPSAGTFTVTGGFNATVGQIVTLVATINSFGSSPVPTGTITFKDGSTTLSTVSLDTTGSATTVFTPVTTGIHSLQAVYSGDSTYINATFSQSLQVNAVTVTPVSTKAVLSAPANVTVGVPFNLTVKVSNLSGNPADGSPTGTVIFMDGLTTTLGSAQLSPTGDNVSSTATISATLTKVGPDPNIVADYQGSSPYQPSNSQEYPITVAAASLSSTKTGITSSLNPSPFGQIVTFTATVSGGSSPSGTVTFVDGSTALGTGSLNSSGVATFTTTTLAAGTHPITAVYAGDTNNLGSISPILTQVIIAGGPVTTTTLTSSLNPSTIGQSVTFSAQVGSLAGPAQLGAVTFTDGAATLGTVTVSGSGLATFTTTTLTVGNHTITAAYGGVQGSAVDYQASTSSPLTQVVNPISGSPSLTLSETLSPTSYSAAGQTIAANFKVTNSGNTSVSGISVSDSLGLQAIACQATTLAAGASTTCSGNYATTAADVTNAKVVDTGQVNGTPTSGTLAPASSPQVTATYVAPSAPALTLSETLSPTSYSAAGQTIAANFKVTNSGNTSVSGISVSDSLGLQAITCQSTTLAAGASTTCSGNYATTAADVTNAKVVDTGQVNGTPASGTLAPASSPQVTATYKAPQVSVTATETISPSRYTNVGQQLTVSVSVTNPNASPLTSLSVTDARAGMLSCPATSIAAQGTVICTGSFLTVAADLTATIINDHASVSGQVNSTPVSAAPASQILSASTVPVSQTQSDISSFLSQRANAILSQEPERSRIEARLSSSSQWSGDQAGGPVSFLMSGMDATGSIDLSASLAKAQKSAAAQGWDVWTEVHAGTFTNSAPTSRSSGNFFIGYAGLDYLVTPDILVGSLVEMDSMRQSTTTAGSPTTNADGVGWMAGPYLGMRIMPHVFFDARGALGLSDDHVSPVGTFVDKFATERGLLEARLSGTWSAGAFTIAPAARLSYFGERQNGFVDAQGVYVPGQYVSLGQSAFGIDLSRAFAFGTDSVIEPKLSLQEIWDFSRTSTIDATGPLPPSIPRGQMSFGATLKTANGLSMSAQVSYDGIGTPNYHAVTGKISVNIPLH